MSVSPVSSPRSANLKNPTDSHAEVSAIAARVEEMKPQIQQSYPVVSSKIPSVAVMEQATDGVVKVFQQFANFSITLESDKPTSNPNEQRVSGHVTDLTSIFRIYPKLQSLTLEDCPYLQTIGLQEQLNTLCHLTLVNLPRLEPTCFTEIMAALPWGRWPCLKTLTVKNCPLFNDETCAQIGTMLENGLTHLVLEDVPTISSRGIGRLGWTINRNPGMFKIESITIQGLKTAEEKQALERLQEIVQLNERMRSHWAARGAIQG